MVEVFLKKIGAILLTEFCRNASSNGDLPSIFSLILFFSVKEVGKGDIHKSSKLIL